MAKASKKTTNNTQSSKAKSKSGGTSAKKPRKMDKRTIEKKKRELRSEISIIAAAFASLLFFLSNFGILGALGNAVRSFERGLFGTGAFVLPILLIAAVVLYVKNKGHFMAPLKALSCGLSMFLLSGVFELMFGEQAGLSFMERYSLSAEGALGGGALGGLLAEGLQELLGTIGAYLLLIFLFIVCMVVITERSFVGAARQGAEMTIKAAKNGKERYEARHEENMIRRRAKREEEELRKKELSFPDLRSMDSSEMADKADVYARYGRDIIEESEKEAEEARFDEAYADEGPEDAIFDTGVIGEMYDYEDDSVPFEEDREERYKSYDYISGGRSSYGGLGRTGSQTDASERGWSGRGHVADSPEGDSEPYEELSAEERRDRLSDPSGIELSAARDFGYAVGHGAEEEELPEEPDFLPESVDAFKPAGLEEASAFDYEQGSILKDKLSDASYKAFSRADGEAEASMGVTLDKGADERYAAFSGEGKLASVKEGAELGAAPSGAITADEAYALGRNNKITASEKAGGIAGTGASSLGKGSKAQTASAEAVIKKEIKKKKPYRFPPKNLLDQEAKSSAGNVDELRMMARKLEQVLKTFGVGVTVKDFTRGPSVTRYEMVPDTGVSVSKITSRIDDIKLTLAASDVRMEAPIPGKAAVGIEVPNKKSRTVYLKEIIASPEFANAKSKLSFAIGEDIQGRIMIGDIAKMPHLLIAGTTGSGKSVGINSLIISLMYKASPEDVRMIMIDPKVVELSPYNGIPHLLIPVVTEAKKAVSTLNWAVAEMTDRYTKFAGSGAKNLESYNEKIEKLRQNLKDAGEEEHIEELPQKLPQIVIIIDELAELMMSADKEVNSKEVEADISRLAQAARAAGMHLVIATQRPSVNVITGVIKANIPSRIAYKTSSAIDSRTILDGSGAETLIGHGDMLYLPIGASQPIRIQGAFVSEDEIERVVNYVSKGNETSYEESVENSIVNQQKLSFSGGEASVVEGDDKDELFLQAGKLLTDMQKASIGMLQRRFKIGFNRAARIMDQLCEAGVVGEEEGTKPRRVLMTKEEYEEFSQK